MCNVWRTASQTWSDSFARHVPFSPFASPLSPHSSTPVRVAPGTSHPQLPTMPSPTRMRWEINIASGRFPRVLTLNQKTWTLYHSSRKIQVTVMTSSGPSPKQGRKSLDLYKSPVGSIPLASTVRAACMYLPTGPSTKGVGRPPRVAHTHTGRSFGSPLM